MITIVGCGPGSPDFLTPAARRAIENADVLVGARRLLDEFPEAQAEIISVGADIFKALDDIAARAADRKIAVLVTGDPGICSLAKPVIRRFGRAVCRVIPGVSSVQAAFAAVGVDWFGARILSAHDEPPRIPMSELVREDRLAVLAGNPKHLDWLDALAESILSTHTVFICENLTLPNESVREANSLRTADLASRCILIFVRRETLI